MGDGGLFLFLLLLDPGSLLCKFRGDGGVVFRGDGGVVFRGNGGVVFRGNGRGDCLH